MMRFALAFVLVCGCDEPPKRERGSFGADMVTKPAVAPDAGPAEVPFAKLYTLAFEDAVKFCIPLMEDTTDDTSGGADLLEMWSRDRMRWSDVAVTKNETSFGKVKKDSQSERGRRMCVSGWVVQITKMRDGTYRGVLHTDVTESVRYEAVGSTGELVQRSRARFCGVVTGVLAYESVASRTVHSVHMVGMFDLPENRHPERQR